MSGVPAVFDGLTPSAIGGVELGTGLALIVHGSLISQYIAYYQRYPKDSVGLKLVVAATGLACLGHIVCITWALFDMSVKSLDDLSKPFAMPITVPIGLVFTSVLQLLVQMTYGYRMFKFSRNYIVPIFVAIGVIYNIVATPAFARKFPLTSFEDQLKYEKSVFWLINSVFINTAVNDVVITLSMVYYLKKGRQDVLQRTQKVIEKLVAWTIQSSAPTCILGFAIVATFMNNVSSNVWIGLSIFATPVYPAALLALLNGRESLTRNVTQVHVSTESAMYSTHGRSVGITSKLPAESRPELRSEFRA
ncbi:hypothetical protein BDN72DRAFT_956269 [Pluteus cervinus]|uniref:Uncharacterized protein n=1 Tax=Pluteus cervinus TaxID=181527 RepID=A0ACD3B6J7_9AGAR|nr:hypothetical protein BDN72DRAFT_956269 [Pluteus cervinus]